MWVRPPQDNKVKKMTIKYFSSLIAASALAMGALGCVAVAQGGGPGKGAKASGPEPKVAAPQKDDVNPLPKVVKTNSEWRKLLPADVFNVTREAGTERPYTGRYAKSHGSGIYRCVACGLELFDSKTKFESGTGWPSFYEPIRKGATEDKTDVTLGMSRTEVLCGRCGSHLGHVFDDGPKPTGLRYCMNSASLTFKPATKETPATKK